MTIDVDMGRKATKTKKQKTKEAVHDCLNEWVYQCRYPFTGAVHDCLNEWLYEGLYHELPFIQKLCMIAGNDYGFTKASILI